MMFAWSMTKPDIEYKGSKKHKTGILQKSGVMDIGVGK